MYSHILLSWYSCIHVFTYPCTLMSMYAYILISSYSGIHVFMHPCIHVFTVRMYPHILVYMYPGIHVSMHPCIHVSLYSCIHASLYPCILVFMYPYILVSLRVSLNWSEQARNGGLKFTRKKEDKKTRRFAGVLLWLVLLTPHISQVHIIIKSD